MNSDKLSICTCRCVWPFVNMHCNSYTCTLFCGIHGYVGVRVHMSADFSTALCTCIRNIPFYYTCNTWVIHCPVYVVWHVHVYVLHVLNIHLYVHV